MLPGRDRANAVVKWTAGDKLGAEFAEPISLDGLERQQRSRLIVRAVSIWRIGRIPWPLIRVAAVQPLGPSLVCSAGERKSHA